jgi:VWFA-related protein
LRTETVSVVVDVIVTDRKGHHVRGLSASDFKLYEDNTPQAIATFTPPAENGKRRQAKATRKDSATSTTSRRVAQERESSPQLITLLIDLGDLHSDSLTRACAAASQFVNKTSSAGNLISVYWVDSRLHLGAPFTRDKQMVLDVIDKLSRRVPAGPFTATERQRSEDELDWMTHQSAAVQPPPGAKSAAPDGMVQARNMLRSWITTANALQARTVFVALRAMALAYRDLPGRKTVVVLSEGFLHALNGGASIEAVIDAANRANVAIYIIDSAGMPVSSPDRFDKNNTSAEKATYDRPDSSPAIGERAGGRATAGMNQFDWLQTLGTDRHTDLGRIATATGGLLVQDNNDIGSALDRVEDDASEFYTLAYSPSNHDYDGAYRKIKVELGKRGYHVRYRRGYWALPPGREMMMTPAAAQLLATIESGERKPSFAPQLNAVLVPSSGGFGVAAAVSMPGKLVHFEKLLGQYQAEVSVLLLARGENGRLLAVHEGFGNMTLKPEDHSDFSAKVFNWQGHVSLQEPQPVTVQAIVRFADGTFGASERTSVDAAQGEGGMRFTGLVLADRSENSACDPGPAEPLCVQGERIMLPAQPQFPRSATLEVYFGVLRIARDSEPGVAPQAYLVVADFDVSTLEPGAYSIETTAQETVARTRSTQRAEFRLQ